jgi:hypothetical protein
VVDPLGEIHVRPWGDFVAVRGDSCCPSAGKFSGRLWGVSRGRRHWPQRMPPETNKVSLRSQLTRTNGLT